MIHKQFTWREWLSYIWLLLRVKIYSLIPLRWLVRYGEILIRIQKKKEKAIRFYHSFRAFLMLFNAGFGITVWSVRDTIRWDLYRFWWNGKIINDMCDISVFDGKKANTTRAGHREELS